MGRMYDIKRIAKAAEIKLCEESDNMYFLRGQRYKEVENKVEQSDLDLYDAAKWLEMAQSMYLGHLRVRCQRVILRDTIDAIGSYELELFNGINYLDTHGIKGGTIYEILCGCAYGESKRSSHTLEYIIRQDKFLDLVEELRKSVRRCP